MVGFCVYCYEPLVSIKHGHNFLRRTVLCGTTKLILNCDILICNIPLEEGHFKFIENGSIFVQFHPVLKYYDFF
jgi:hypothetical protein